MRLLLQHRRTRSLIYLQLRQLMILMVNDVRLPW